MNTTATYTPLESLLLFQSLAAHGTKPDAFSRISDLLKNNPLVKDGDTYDPGRLSPDALRELYLQLLREELRNEVQGDGHEDTPSRKRKLQSPPLPTIKDPDGFIEKLPQLVDRLYTSYRDHMIGLIREDERRYDILQREIAEIERGEWDDRILKEDRAGANKNAGTIAEASRSRRASTASPLPAHSGQETKLGGSPVADQKDGQRSSTKRTSASPVPSPRTEPKPEGLAINDVLNNSETVPSSPKATEPTARVHNGSQALPPLTHGLSPLQPVQQRPPEGWKWESYQGVPQGLPPPPFPPSPNYTPFPQQQYSSYQPPPPPPRGSFSIPSIPHGHGIAPSQGLPSPQGHVPPSPLSSHHPHPIVLPPPNITRGPGSPPTRHLDQLADVAEQQYRVPPVPPLAQHGTMQSPPFGQPYPPFSPQYRPNDGRPPSANGMSPQWNQQFMQPYPPPLQPGQRPFPRPEIIQLEQRQYNSPYNPSQGPRRSPVEQSRPVLATTPRPHPQREVNAFPYTPLPFGLQHSTGRGTRWTPTPTASTPKIPKSPVQPAFEPLSPMPPFAKLPVAIEPAAKKESPKARPREKAHRGGRRTRVRSTPSSAIAGSYRSQSVASHADELSLDNDVAITQRVKQESSTPRPIDDTGDTTADENVSRPRPSALKESHSARHVQKRKRLKSRDRSPPGPPTYVLWTRNFPKISSSALERIGAHRYASTFALPIKERDAPGYKDIIIRPQDLKSIRTALVSGNKCGAAAAAAKNDQGQASILLPISEDLIPPKGIVNNAQLEKELMRMFANAIMFNPDPNRGFGRAFEAKRSIEGSNGSENYQLDENGVVKMTRAMFSDAEKIVGEMRSAERRSEGLNLEVENDEIDELAGDGDHGGSVVKRRRRA